MRHKFSFLKLKTPAPQRGLDFALQVEKTFGIFRANPKGARFFVAERADAGKLQIKARRINARKRVDGAVKAVPIRLADKGERQVKIFNGPPARALYAVLERC